jgi:hypothetical protein
MAVDEEVFPAVPLLLDAAPVACAAALNALVQVEQQVMSMLSDVMADQGFDVGKLLVSGGVMADRVFNVGKLLAGVSSLESSCKADLDAVQNALALLADSGFGGQCGPEQFVEAADRKSC